MRDSNTIGSVSIPHTTYSSATSTRYLYSNQVNSSFRDRGFVVQNALAKHNVVQRSRACFLTFFRRVITRANPQKRRLGVFDARNRQFVQKTHGTQPRFARSPHCKT